MSSTQTDYSRFELSNLLGEAGERAYLRKLKINHYSAYVNMHMLEQYKSESSKADASMWQSYDMVYNLSKFKVDEEFLQANTEVDDCASDECGENRQCAVETLD